jgi:hypothetical protein
MQLMLQQGSLIVRVWKLSKAESIEVDSPNSSVTLLKPGLYRIGFDGDADTTKVVVRGSEAEVLAADSTFRVQARQQARVTGGPDGSATYDVTEAAPADDFDKWSNERDNRMTSASTEYVSHDMIGYEDLGESGTWKVVPEYGAVWQPTAVAVGWVPYRFGRWAWVAPWGWTWIDDASWGFAPFHYGRWAFYGGAWVWAPGPLRVRHWYAPALVGFLGGGSWGVSFGVGGGFAWFPLGPRDAFAPFYRASPAYIRRVNVNVNVTNVNIANVAYVNRSVPGAVTAASQETIALSRHVGAAASAISPAAAKAAPVTGTAPALAPRTQSVLAGQGASGSVAHPPTAVTSRAVVTRMAPAPSAVPFEAQKTALARHPGRPVDGATLASLRGKETASTRTRTHPASTFEGSTLKPAREGLPAKTTYNAAAAPPTGSTSPKAHTKAGTAPANGKKSGKGHESDPKQARSMPKHHKPEPSH